MSAAEQNLCNLNLQIQYKKSPREFQTQNDDQLDISSQETTPSSAFPMMHLRPEDSFNTSMDQNSTYTPPCDADVYQPSYQPQVNVADEMSDHPPKIKSECHDMEEMQTTLNGHADTTLTGLHKTCT